MAAKKQRESKTARARGKDEGQEYTLLGHAPNNPPLPPKLHLLFSYEHISALVH